MSTDIFFKPSDNKTFIEQLSIILPLSLENTKLSQSQLNNRPNEVTSLNKTKVLNRKFWAHNIETPKVLWQILQHFKHIILGRYIPLILASAKGGIYLTTLGTVRGGDKLNNELTNELNCYTN